MVSPMNNVPTVTTMRYLVPHNFNTVKAPRARSLPTLLIPSLTLWEFIARNLQTMIVLNNQENLDQAIETCKTFYDAVLDEPDDGGRQ